MNTPVILSHNQQKICERAGIIPIFIKYVGVKAKKAERNIKNLRLWAEASLFFYSSYSMQIIWRYM